MINVLVFGLTHNSGGMESVIMNYYREIDRSQIHFDFLCNTQEVAFEEELVQSGATIYKIPARKQNFFKFRKALKQVLRSKKYDVIWVNLCSLTNIDYLKEAKKAGIKMRIIHSHNSQNMGSFLAFMLHKIGKSQIQHYATDFWSCSQEASNWFYSKKIQDSSKHRIINNAIDIEKFAFNESIRNEYRKKLGLEKSLVIGHVGRFHFQKNHEFIIKVFLKIKQAREDAKLLLIGQGEDETKIKNLVTKLGLREDVQFLGIRRDIPALLQAMDIFLFPSLFEGLSVSLLEAQAAGLAVYTSDVISPQTKVCDRFHTLSLCKDEDYWATYILTSYDAKYDRSINYHQMKASGFDIHNQTNLIENEFLHQGASNMKQSLYVITHKEVNNIYTKDRKIMMVGAKNKHVPEGYYLDYQEALPNISDKNANYCELTGLYYFYKNDEDADVLGLEHYRRLFVKRRWHLFHYPFLQEKDVAKILYKYDIIVPKPTYWSITLYQQYSREHIINDLDKVVKIINDKYPEYMTSLNNVLNGKKIYQYNMFIAKKAIVKAYCDWLFSVLFELEKNIDLAERDDYQKRVFGFLSERMFTIWLDKNSQYKKYECDIEFIESNIPFGNMLKKIKRRVKRLISGKSY